ncbi:hypothetical protein ACWGJ2_01005 [Streptomyces sp. NPDC054796]
MAVEVTYVERPTAPQALLPFLGLYVVALSDGHPVWDGQLIAISDRVHIRKYSGEIAEFILSETIFKCVREK